MKTTIAILTVGLATTAWGQTALQETPAWALCYNEAGHGFTLEAQSNPRNEAKALLSNLKGDLDMGGVWLWLTSNEGGELSTLTEYKTMNGGKLLISTQTMTGPHQCTRVSCGPSTITTTKAKYVANENSEAILFSCY